jgi:hypothetical protein
VEIGDQGLGNRGPEEPGGGRAGGVEGRAGLDMSWSETSML